MKNTVLAVLGLLLFGLAACRSAESSPATLPELRYYEIADT